MGLSLLKENHILQKGILLTSFRLDRYRVTEKYLLGNETYIIERYYPSEYAKQEKDLVETEKAIKSYYQKGKNIMALNLNKSKVETTPALSLGKKPQMQIEGFAMAKEVKELFQELKSLITGVKQEVESFKALQVSGQASDKQMIALLQTIAGATQQMVSVNTGVKEKPVDTNTGVKEKAITTGETKNLYASYKLNGGTIDQEATFNAWIKTLNTSSRQALNDSSKHKVTGIEGYIYAPKNKAKNIDALWIALSGQGDPVATPGGRSKVLDAGYFADSLQVEKQAILEVINQVKESGLSAGDDDLIAEYLIDEGMDEDLIDEYQGFYNWLESL